MVPFRCQCSACTLSRLQLPVTLSVPLVTLMSSFPKSVLACCDRPRPLMHFTEASACEQWSRTEQRKTLEEAFLN